MAAVLVVTVVLLPAFLPLPLVSFFLVAAVTGASTFPFAMNALRCSIYFVFTPGEITGAFSPTAFNACCVKNTPECPLDPRSLFPLVGPGLQPFGMFGLYSVSSVGVGTNSVVFPSAPVFTSAGSVESTTLTHFPFSFPCSCGCSTAALC